jgi:hypothetical protein
MRNFLSELRDVFSSNSMARNPILGKMDPRDMAQGLSDTQPMPPAAANALFGLVPGIGDVNGLVQDAAMYASDPRSRTLGNFALSGLGALPFVPNLAMLAGPLARTADISALERARAMLKTGADDSAVWKETGWWVNTPDGVPRFEMPDSIENFQKAYPQSGVQFVERPGIGGNYGNKTVEWGKSDVPTTLAHETQHAVQDVEGMAKGAGHVGRYGVTQDHITAVKADFDAPDVRAKMAENQQLWGHASLSEDDWADLASQRQYSRSAGEAEARAVEARYKFTEQMRRETPPWANYDVPLNALIVRK